MTSPALQLLPDFEHIDYLQYGSAVQQEVFHLLHRKKILYHLKSIQPVVAGTLPLDLFIKGKSDIDILGQSDDLTSVEKILLKNVSIYDDFFLEIKPIRQAPSLICRFTLDNFPFEIFVQTANVKEQYGYRHMVVEWFLMKQYGEPFKEKILALKLSGMKTEPAFAHALGLQGDPYDALLVFEKDPDFKILFNR